MFSDIRTRLLRLLRLLRPIPTDIRTRLLRPIPTDIRTRLLRPIPTDIRFTSHGSDGIIIYKIYV